jgi:L-malate glycosyltransferase
MSDQRIKVLQVIKSLGRGGAETLLVETLKLHDKENFDFHYIYFLPWKNQLVEGLIQNGGKVSCFAANNNVQLLLKVRKLVRYIRENQIDLIHAHLPWAGVVARLAGKITGVPVIYTEHNKQERYHFATRLLNLASMNLLSTVVAVSGDVEESIRKHKPGLKAKLTTILNGVNVDHFRPDNSKREATRATLGIPANANVIITIAVFRFQKRLDLWLEIAAKILRKNPRTHFIIVGDGPLKLMVNEKRDQLDLTGNVHLVGLQTEVRPYLAASDIYMMSSIFEGLPIALLEAMSFGLPVVSTDAGGIKEVVRHQRDGLLTGVDQSEALVDFALTLISDTNLLTTMGQSARERIVADFSMKKMVAELQALYYTFADHRN